MCYLKINAEKCGFSVIHLGKVVVLCGLVKKKRNRNLKIKIKKDGILCCSGLVQAQFLGLS